MNDLRITNNLGTYEIEGEFTSKNSLLVREKFNYLLDHYEEVVMCLGKVKKIDKSALCVLLDIYSKAKRRSKVLFVLGKKNKYISDMFTKSQMNYIFKNDYY
ncbi:STAS domain-containing protein [Aquimarina rhabdastrellae]